MPDSTRHPSDVTTAKSPGGFARSTAPKERPSPITPAEKARLIYARDQSGTSADKAPQATARNDQNAFSDLSPPDPRFMIDAAVDSLAQIASEELVVSRIDEDELSQTIGQPPAFIALLRRHRAPTNINRAKDDAPRKFHANVRLAIEKLQAAENRDDLISAARASTELGEMSSIRDLMLILLGSYDLTKGANGKVIDGYFLSRDRGIQDYLQKHRISSHEAEATIKQLGGVHLTYTTSCAERAGRTANAPVRISLEKATLTALPDQKVGDEIDIRVKVLKPGKLQFVGAIKLS